MKFQIATTFLDSLTRLTAKEQAQAKKAAFDFQVDPAHPSFKFHRIQRSREKHFWSFRVSSELRVVVYKTEEDFTLCYAGHHDDAYSWAERRHYEVHPTTGAVQLVETRETVEEVVRRVVREEEQEPAIFARYGLGYLLGLGVPVEWADWIHAATEDQLLEVLHRLPSEAAERLMSLAAGEPVALPSSASTQARADSGRHLIEISDMGSLSQALDAPWDRWMVFLHPTQREFVERELSGPGKVFGSAGTGKTVVALHRAARLARSRPSARVLLTTYTTTLAARLEVYLDQLMGAGGEARGRVEVATLHGVARGLVKRAQGQAQAIGDKALRKLLADARRRRGVEEFSAEFLLAEWQSIIEPLGVTQWGQYRSAPRTGRGRGLDAQQRKRLWGVFEDVLSQLELTGQATWSGLCHAAAGLLEGHPGWRYDHVIADEGQDFGFAELRLLRALAAPGVNDLFLCADAGQRIYAGRPSWLQAGIDVRGRSQRLRINYRTTEQIRRLADGLLPGSLADGDGEAEARRSFSLLSGPEPELSLCGAVEAEVEALGAWIAARLSEGLEAHEIGVFARTEALVSGRARPAVEGLGVGWQRLTEAPPEVGGGVCLGTMHRAKGLEFKAVAVIGCEAGQLPSGKLLAAMGDPADQELAREQERNLLYVACTRARQRLLVSCAGTPSPFLTASGGEEVDAGVDRAAPRARSVVPGLPLGAGAPAAERARFGALPRSPFGISPSMIAQSFNHECERHLRFRALRSEARRIADGAPPQVEESGGLSQAIFDSGHVWEERVLTTHLSGRVLIADGGEALHERHFGLEDTLAVLRDARAGQYIYQPTLRAPEGFYALFGLDATLVTVSDNRPDLIEVSDDGQGGRLLRVVDVKRGQHVRLSYRAQILFYALELSEIVKAQGLAGLRVDLERGKVWLGGEAEPSLCDLRGVRPHLEQRLREELPRVLTQAPGQVQWHVQASCEWCPLLEHCRGQMRQEDDVSRVPYLTARAKGFLNARGVRDLAELRGYLEGEDEDLEQCASLRGKRLQLQDRVQSLLRGEVYARGQASMALPRATLEEISVFITLQREPLSQRVFLAGLRVEAGAGVEGRLTRHHGRGEDRVFVAGRPEDSAEVWRRFVVELSTLLHRVDAHNLAMEVSGQGARRARLQVYAYSNLEMEIFIERLLGSLEDEGLSGVAKELLLYFQGPGLVLSEGHPETHVAYPLVSLLNVMSGMLAVPVEVSYTLPESLSALGSGVGYARDEALHHPLGHALRSEWIFEAWHRDRADRVEALVEAGRSWLGAVGASLEAIRAHASSQAVFPAQRFSLPELAPIRDPFISRLVFLTRYESFLSFQAVRGGRLIPRDEVPYAAQVVELRSLGGDRLAVVGEPSAGLEASDFGRWLLVVDTQEGRRAQLTFPDYTHRAWHPFKGGGRLPGSPHRAVVSIKEVEQDSLGRAVGLTLGWVDRANRLQPKAGERYLLYERFTDFNVDKVVEALRRLDGRPLLLARLLTGESKVASCHAPVEAAIRAEAEVVEPALGFTASQRAAWCSALDHRVTAVWGPPGTGKTHFLASMILGLVEAHHRQGRAFRVIITAFTHGAIENLLRKIHELRQGKDGFRAPLKVAKADDWKGERYGEAPKAKGLGGWLGRNRWGVVGATVYQLMKDEALEGSELIVVDEASQVKVPEAMIPARLMGESGRIVFAGDHLQLPPIIAGRYPEPGAGQPALHRSIFEALLSLEGGALRRQLLENFRMNDVLTGVSARLLYGEGYVCESEGIGARRLRYEAPPGAGALERACLEPSGALTVVLIDGVEATNENATEAQVVARLVCALREGLRGDGGLYEDDARFFKEGVCVVSPHRAHIRTIRRALRERRAWGAAPFVETVEKMQGQEADAVVVSYGVSDAEYAQREGSFIYSVNRLNVAITRARVKTILILSRPLLEGTPRVLEDEEAAEGLATMRRLVQMAQSGSGGDVFILGDAVTAEVFSLAEVP